MAVEYRIVIEKHADQRMVHTYITGDLYVGARDRISVETIQLLNDEDIHKTIWDMREATLKYSLTRIHESVVNAKTAGLKDENYVALIYRNNQREYEHAKNVTEILKLTNLNYFQNIDQGIEWLINK
jgi:hypothetical protein